MKQYDAPPAMQIDSAKTYRATISTNQGDIVLNLDPSQAPKTVNNFGFLAQDGFYDGMVFHRVSADFMVQGGCPAGTGTGGPGYKFEDEFTGNSLRHERGVISMANAGPNTNGSQFFLTHGPQPHLDNRHTVFGKVVEGMDVVDSIEGGDVMESVVIVEV